MNHEAETSSSKEEKEVVHLDAYKVTAQDKTTVKILEEANTRVHEVLKQIQEQGSDKFQFKSKSAREAARKIVLANIAAEASALKLLLACIRANNIKAEQDFTEDAFHDMHAFMAWLSFIQKIHDESLQGIHAHLQQIVAAQESREKEINRLIQNSIVCQVHNQPAIGRSLDGKSVICKKCNE